jgi:hypothetical protein
MQLNDLLKAGSVDPERTLVLRHRPSEPRFRKALPLLAGERLDLFDAYQAYQNEAVERSINANVGGWIASFIAYGPGKAVFVGVYQIAGARPMTLDEFWARPENVELRLLGNKGFTADKGRETILRFDLQVMPLHDNWRGKLVVEWPGGGHSWCRRAHKNTMPIFAIREESVFAEALPPWDEVEFTWAELAVLPTRWRAALEQWRGIYSIWDASDGKSYVGSAYGETNILGRWESYAATGHGGNKLLRHRNPAEFRFTILQRVSPDMEDVEVIRLENSWKLRLHTRAPHGMNEK